MQRLLIGRLKKELHEAEQISMSIAENSMSCHTVATERHHSGRNGGGLDENGKGILVDFASTMESIDIIWHKKSTAFGPSFASIKDIEEKLDT